jgi:gluconolactonase
MAMSWKFDRVAGPYQGHTGGVVWDGRAVLFSAVREERILAFDPVTGATDIFRRWSGRTNGLAVGADGALYGAQEGGRRIIRFMSDGSTAPTEDLIDGVHHNQPTDLVVDRAGRVWFTDPYNPVPPYGPPGAFPSLDYESVLRLQRNRNGEWEIVRVTQDTQSPRALALSPDEKMLYVAVGDAGKEGPRELRAYSLDVGGNVAGCTVLHKFGDTERGIEGLCLDSSGNVIASGGSKQGGAGPFVYLFSPSGTLLEEHALPPDADEPMRCAFGDADLGSLYVTTGTGELYRAKSIGRRGLAHTATLSSPSRFAMNPTAAGTLPVRDPIVGKGHETRVSDRRRADLR